MDKLIWKLDKLILNEKNPRGIKKNDFERLKKQIKKLGMYKPVLITPEGKVLGGNMRVRAYKDMGIEDVWVSIVNPANETEEMEYILSDNDRAGYWEEQDLAELLSQMPELDLESYKIDLGDQVSLKKLMDEYRPEEVNEGEIPELEEEAVSKLGEIYQLGRHRLMCGDSTKIEQVEALMGGIKANMCFTDPPYNVDYGDSMKDTLRGNNKKILNDNMTDEEFDVFLNDSMGNILTFTEGACYICMSSSEMGSLQDAFKKNGGHWSTFIIWAKNTFTIGRSDYQRQYEPMLYGWREGVKKRYWCGDRGQGDVWNFNKPTSSKLHPTMKPVELCVRAIKNSSEQNGVVLDLFGGSGSTLIASEHTDRICYMMELDPRYVDVIRKRYANFIGKEEEWEKNTPRES